MDENLQPKINILSKTYNYFENKKAETVLKTMNEEEAKIILNNEKVKKTILRIDDINVLRKIFRLTPAFFQEIMFGDEKIQNLLIQPSVDLTSKKLIEIYQRGNYSFEEHAIRKLGVFINTIKSPKIYDKLIENKYFQRTIALFKTNDIRRSFFKDLDEVKLFYNIVNDKDLYDTLTNERKERILELFNKVSYHLLLSKDYYKVIPLPSSLLSVKRWLDKDKQIIVSEEALSMMSTSMILTLFSFTNIDRDFIENYIKEKVISDIVKNNYQFESIFNHLIEFNHRILTFGGIYGENKRFNDIDFIYFNKIIDECKNDLVLKDKFMDFVFKVLVSNTVVEKDEENLIKQNLFKVMSSKSITIEDYKNLFLQPSLLKLIFYLKFGQIAPRMDYLNGISYKQLMFINVKHINQILSYFNVPNEDELSNIYSYAIKLYLVFGLERSLRIRDGEYGEIDRVFFDNLSRVDIKSVNLIKEGNKYIPVLSKGFLDFMFANKENNHFIEMLNDQNSLLRKNWSYLYNNFSEIKEKCHGVITLKKLNVILKQLSPTRDLSDVTPDNYRLKEDNILDDVCLGNKTMNPNEMIYKDLLDIYDKMKRRIESSIPYVKGIASNGYSYEMMKLNDPIAFTVGYRGNCCYRVDDIGHNHLLHSVLCRNGRILLIYDENHQLTAFVPLKRNGEVLIANSIECSHKTKNDKAIKSFRDAIKDIVNTSLINKDDEYSINLVCIGEEAYAKPTGIPFPNNISIPTIYEKNDPIYYDTDCYHRNLRIVYKNPNLNLNELKYGDPKCSYYDEREKILTCNFTNRNDPNIDKALKVIDAIRYTKCDIEEKDVFRSISPYRLKQCIFNEDWYLVIDYLGNIYGDYLNYNKKAELEFKITYQELTKKLNKIDDNNYQKVKKLS